MIATLTETARESYEYYLSQPFSHPDERYAKYFLIGQVGLDATTYRAVDGGLRVEYVYADELQWDGSSNNTETPPQASASASTGVEPEECHCVLDREEGRYVSNLMWDTHSPVFSDEALQTQATTLQHDLDIATHRAYVGIPPATICETREGGNGELLQFAHTVQLGAVLSASKAFLRSKGFRDTVVVLDRSGHESITPRSFDDRIIVALRESLTRRSGA